MSVKRHRFKFASPGDYFGIKLDDNKFGYILVLKGSGIGILPVVSHERITDVSQLKCISPADYAFFFAPKDDPTEIFWIGNIPFMNDDEGHCPPTASPADEYKSFNQIYYRGTKRRATSDEIVGLPIDRSIPPRTIAKEILACSSDWPVITLPSTT